MVTFKFFEGAFQVTFYGVRFYVHRGNGMRGGVGLYRSALRTLLALSALSVPLTSTDPVHKRVKVAEWVSYTCYTCYTCYICPASRFVMSLAVGMQGQKAYGLCTTPLCAVLGVIKKKVCFRLPDRPYFFRADPIFFFLTRIFPLL